jgi:tetratricopeptide (TPR) repeat protein
MPERDLTVVGDFLRYAGMLFVPFCVIGAIYGFFNGFSFMALLVNPCIYSVGISLIIIVISYDINTILSVVGLGKEPRLSAHIMYNKEIQEIGMLMSMANYDSALKKVDLLLRKEPAFAMAHNLRGEILLEGFHQNRQARDCFDRAIKLSNPEDEEYQLATSLKASTYDS